MNEKVIHTLTIPECSNAPVASTCSMKAGKFSTSDIFGRIVQTSSDLSICSPWCPDAIAILAFRIHRLSVFTITSKTTYGIRK